MTNKPSFSLYGFKKWVFEQKDLSNFFDIKREEIEEEEKNGLIGETVYSKVSTDKLINKIKTNVKNVEDLIEDFEQNGGVVRQAKEKSFVIEVESGTFSLPKFCVKI